MTLTMNAKTKIFCCGCNADVSARLTNGSEIYPHRQDLQDLPFWKCDQCGNHVGCHHKTRNRTKPLGCIPTAEIRNARQHIHSLIDPAWKSGRLSRSFLYGKISSSLGREFHTAEIRTIEDARKIYRLAKSIIKKFSPNQQTTSNT
jgi:hypothetical protein